MANKKITDATTATSVAGTDKVFLNQGGDLKQVDLNSAVANSQAVQTLNSNLAYESFKYKGDMDNFDYDFNNYNKAGTWTNGGTNLGYKNIPSGSYDNGCLIVFVYGNEGGIRQFWIGTFAGLLQTRYKSKTGEWSAWRNL